MRLKFKRFASILLVAVLCLAITACDVRPSGTGVQGRLSGVYANIDDDKFTIEFVDENTAYIKQHEIHVSAPYTLDGDNLTIAAEIWGLDVSIHATVSADGNSFLSDEGAFVKKGYEDSYNNSLEGNKEDEQSQYDIKINGIDINDVTKVNEEYYGNLKEIIDAIGASKYKIDYRNSSAQVNLWAGLGEYVIKFNFDGKPAKTTMTADVMDMNRQKRVGGLNGYYDGKNILINPLDLKEFLFLKNFDNTEQPAQDGLNIAISDKFQQYKSITLEQQRENDLDMQKKCLDLLKEDGYSWTTWVFSTDDEKKEKLYEFLQKVQGILNTDIDLTPYIDPETNIEHKIIVEELFDENGKKMGWSSGLFACYCDRDDEQVPNRIVINKVRLYDYRLFKTIIHECRHAYQQEAIRKEQNHIVSIETVEAWAYNKKSGNYISGKGINKETYKAQAVEWDAKHFAKQENDILEELKGITAEYAGIWPSKH